MSDEQGNRDDKFTAQPGDLVASQCVYCRHLSPGTFTPGCKAFPGGIPDDVLTNSTDHRHPIDGDDGIRFEPRGDVTPDQLFALYAALSNP